MKCACGAEFAAHPHAGRPRERCGSCVEVRAVEYQRRYGPTYRAQRKAAARVPEINARARAILLRLAEAPRVWT